MACRGLPALLSKDTAAQAGRRVRGNNEEEHPEITLLDLIGDHGLAKPRPG